MGLAETFDPMRPARVILPSNSAGVLEFMGERLLLCADGQSARQHLSHVHDPDDEVHPRVCQSVIGPLVRRGDIGLHLRIGPLCSFKRVRIEHRFCCVQHHHIDHGLFFSVRRRGRLQGGGGHSAGFVRERVRKCSSNEIRKVISRLPCLPRSPHLAVFGSSSATGLSCEMTETTSLRYLA